MYLVKLHLLQKPMYVLFCWVDAEETDKVHTHMTRNKKNREGTGGRWLEDNLSETLLVVINANGDNI